MAVLGLVLLVVGIALVGFGAVMYANGVGVAPERSSGSVGDDAKQTFGGMSWQGFFGRMPSSVKGMVDSDATKGDHMRATGAFCGMAGLVVVFLAILALIASLL